VVGVQDLVMLSGDPFEATGGVGRRMVSKRHRETVDTQHRSGLQVEVAFCAVISEL
jgi:hypothetical protein